MERRRFYQLSVLRLLDSPEARIAEDGRIAIVLFIDFATRVTNALLIAALFVVVLWFFCGSLTFWGITIPGVVNQPGKRETAVTPRRARRWGRE
jgi:putative ATP-binding cassette transporter